MNTPEALDVALAEAEVFALEQPLKAGQWYSWLDNWKSLYDSFFLPPLMGKAHDFYNQYSHLQEKRKWLQLVPACELANKDFAALDVSDESVLIPWLLSWEEMDKAFGLFVYNQLDDSFEMSVIEDSEFTYDSSDFQAIQKFYINFYVLYYEMFSKYNVLSDEEAAEMDNDEIIANQSQSLRYHLKQRGLYL